jgi:DNA-binding transcriptional ArsR family regulator
MTYETTLSALADATRRQVFQCLASGPKSVGEIATRFTVSRPAISQHLGILKAAHLVSEQRIGTRRIYRLNAAGIHELRAWLDTIWGEALSELKILSEKADER